MKLLTKKYGNTSIRWQYNMTNGDRDVTKAYLEQQSGDNWEVVKEISVVRKPTEKNDKLKARYFALGKLIQESFTRNDGDLEDRKTIWNVFKETCKQPLKK